MTPALAGTTFAPASRSYANVLADQGAQDYTAQAAAPAGTVYYIHADHLNTPRVIEDRNQNLVWSWDQAEPFGDTPPNDSPAGFGAFEFNLRGAGQYSDRETGIIYNYFRYLDPARGQYEQSDPIGLVGGLNTYLHTGANPLSKTDPMGLVSCDGAKRGSR